MNTRKTLKRFGLMRHDPRNKERKKIESKVQEKVMFIEEDDLNFTNLFKR